MKLFHEYVYKLIVLNFSLVFVAIFIFWTAWPSAKLAFLYTFLFFLPGLSIAQNVPLNWLEHFALAHVVGMTFPIVYTIWNILGMKLNSVLYILMPVIVLVAGMWWHNKGKR